MADIRWGAKRRCAECEAAFYDMQRTPITCPKCGAAYKPQVLLKPDGRPPRKNRVRPSAPSQAQAVRDPAEAEAEDALPVIEDAESGDEADEADKESESAEEN
jgi:uncharacterized protein (TIGR02300 family)